MKSHDRHKKLGQGRRASGEVVCNGKEDSLRICRFVLVPLSRARVLIAYPYR
jgi:hypothetical protein